jgi:hypothetical protein
MTSFQRTTSATIELKSGYGRVTKAELQIRISVLFSVLKARRSLSSVTRIRFSNELRRRANERMKYITRVTRGTGLQRIGVGAINDASSAIERLEAEAQAVQVVTGIR